VFGLRRKGAKICAMKQTRVILIRLVWRRWDNGWIKMSRTNITPCLLLQKALSESKGCMLRKRMVRSIN